MDGRLEDEIGTRRANVRYEVCPRASGRAFETLIFEMIGVGEILDGMGIAGKTEEEAIASDELGRQPGICDVDAGSARGIDVGSLLSSALEREIVVVVEEAKSISSSGRPS